jgi:fructose transport system substrate-binding protein
MKIKFSRKALVAMLAVSALTLSACSSSSDDASGDIKVSLILKNQSNPFFVAMIKGAEAKADELGLDLTIS